MAKCVVNSTMAIKNRYMLFISTEILIKKRFIWLKKHLQKNLFLLGAAKELLMGHYFCFSDMERKKKEEEKKHKESENTKEFPNKKRNMILAGIFAATSMLTYAFLSGLIRIEVMDDDPIKVDPH